MSKLISQLHTKNLSPFCVWALALGCCVGWGAFIMPDTTFLPVAGPLGAPLALFLGALSMLFVAANYQYMINREPGCGGPFSYLIRHLGYDHAFFCAWFLWLVYVALLWANVTAFPLIVRALFGPLLQVGLLYHLAGYDIYLGEVVFCLALLIFFAVLTIFRHHLSLLLNTLFALLLLAGSLLCFSSVLTETSFFFTLLPALF